MGIKVQPVLVRACERIRYCGVEVSSIHDTALPGNVPLGGFEYFYQGIWHKAMGSYDCGGEPAVWLVVEEVKR